VANEGSSTSERTAGFLVRLLVSLVLPAWGLVMIAIGAIRGKRMVGRDGYGRARDWRGFLRR
jgi:hypothetical protein